jgi:hypothetical protein
MATTAQYASTPRCAIAQATTANTARDGTGTIATVFTSGTNGSRIDAIDIKAVSTTTAGMIRLFIHDGTNTRLLTELPVTAITPSATQPSFEAQLNNATLAQVLPLVIPTGYSLRASTEKTETFNILAFGGDF